MRRASKSYVLLWLRILDFWGSLLRHSEIALPQRNSTVPKSCLPFAWSW